MEDILHGRAALIVDLDKIYENLKYLEKITARKAIPVIKADGYGLGSIRIARYLESRGYALFAVATFDEAMELRESGIKSQILILSGSPDDPFDEMERLNIVPVLYSLDQYRQLKVDKLRVHLKFNTGMNRLGFDIDNFPESILDDNRLQIDGVMTHFSKADTSVSYTKQQISRFKKILKRYDLTGVKYIHTANSAASLNGTVYGNMIRPGIFIYGSLPNPEFKRPMEQKLPFQFLCKILEVRNLKTGDRVSYGGTFIAKKETKIAIAGCGYGDGIPRVISNKGHFAYINHLLPVVGRVCMDMTVLDVTSVPYLKRGDTVMYMGDNGSVKIYPDDVAKIANTIGYELLTSISRRVQRIYK